MQTRVRHPRGFTLIELLTVIAIIGILAAIIIPVVGKVRQTARSSQCVSNLRQIGLAFSLYREDNKDRFPGVRQTIDGVSHSWSTLVLPYVSQATKESVDGKTPPSVFACPSTERTAGGIRVATYGLNLHLANWNQFKNGSFATVLAAAPTAFSQIPAPSRTYLAADADKHEFQSYQKGEFAASTGGTIAPKDRHQDKLNMLYADGHISSVAYSEMLWSADGGNSMRMPWGLNP